MSTKKLRSVMLGLALASAATLPALAGTKAPKVGLAAGGLAGSRADMQPVNLPARVSRIAHVPGTSGREAWAIGHINAKRPGWDNDSPSGQLVFLHYTAAAGWDVLGPPKDGAGNFTNPVVSNLALVKSGEGWAVGPSGTVLHHVPGGGWTSVGCPSITCTDLYGLSLRQDGATTTGYAVGQGSTVLRLSGGAWTPDDRPVIGSSVDLNSVVASPDGDAWAVGQASSREMQIYRRETAGWNRKLTGKPIFDNPFPGSVDQGAVNLAALGTSVGATPDGDSVWFGGGFYPVDPGNTLDDAERPFTILWERNTNAFTSYCPRLYSLSNDKATTEDICDKPMPISPFNITSFSVQPGGEVFAGGMGLFHFKDGQWFREPDAVGYLSSVSFASANEGWVATTGNTIGVGGAARSSSITVGHYTTNPDQPRSARWPQFNKEVLKGVATLPNGKAAIAVGDNGVVMQYDPEAGWDKHLRRSFNNFNAVAWSSPSEAWAVGTTGLVARIKGGTTDVIFDQGMIVGEGLLGVAFASGRGFAVGGAGVILSYDGNAWRKDPDSTKLTRNALYSVTASGNGFMAVGAAGTLLVNPTGAPGGWSVDVSIVDAIRLPRVSTPDLFSIQALPDGTLLVGGARGALVRKDPGVGWRNAAEPIDADHSIIEAKGFKDSRGKLKIFASVSPDLAKYQGNSVSTSQSWMMFFDGNKWTDISYSHFRTPYGKTDLSAATDPVFSIAVESGGRAWGVGGTPINVPDQDGHINGTPTSSIYRFDMSGDPSPRDTLVTPRFPSAGFNFAAIGESGCGTGACSVAVGAGNAADEVPLAIQREVNALSRSSNGPDFLIHAGDMRSVGLREEVGQFAGFLGDFKVPVFAAIGPRDVFSAASAGAVNTPPGIGDAFRRSIDTPQATPANRFYLEQFSSELAPWGTPGARDDPRFIPVDILDDGDAGLARTYYAFDYAPEGTPVARFVVLDTSDKSYAKTPIQQVNQNPPLQDQATWFNAVIANAFNRTPLLPTIVVMSTPTVNPTTSVENDRLGMLTDGPSFETNAAGTLGVSAVLTSLLHSNSTYYVESELVPNRVPFYVLGGAGSALEGTKAPLDGFYHAWQLINVDTAGVGLLNPQAKVSVTSIPILESVALHARDGRYAPGGNTLSFEGLGRGIDAGGPPGDTLQSQRLYINFPIADRCSDSGPFYGGCLARSALKPDFHFYSDDPTIATFVQANPTFQSKLPLVSNGHLVADDQSGMLCTFKAGNTFVNLVSGIHRARMPITVGPGFGPCVKHPVAGIVIPPVLRVPAPVFPAEIVKPPIFHPPPLPEALVVLLPPAPGPIAAPAPPASAAGARKEEEEPQHESEGQEGEQEFRALPMAERSGVDPVMGWVMLGAACWMGAMGAIAASRVNRRRPEPIYARWRS